MSRVNVLVIGGTGFVGGHVIELLAKKHPEFHLTCLVRNANLARLAALKKLNANVETVNGDLDDRETISKQAEQAHIVIHLAHSDHLASVEAVLDGLSRQAVKGSDGRSPIYLHMSGMGVLADNVRGEKVDYVKEWTDIDFKLEDCPQDNTHLPCDRKIVEASTRHDRSIRTAIVFPGMIYGLGKARRSTGWLPLFINLAKQSGHSGTWGPGEVHQDCIHVEDVANAVIVVLDAMLEGKVIGGEDALFFVASDEPTMGWKEVLSTLGDKMYSKGLVGEPGAKPYPTAITDAYGSYGWSLLGSNAHGRSDRLRSLAWNDEKSKENPIRDVLPQMIDIALEGETNSTVRVEHVEQFEQGLAKGTS